MDAKLEKDLAVMAMRVAALNNRGQTVLLLADLLNEYVQVTTTQQKLIQVLTERLNAYESKNPEPTGETVRGQASASP